MFPLHQCTAGPGGPHLCASRLLQALLVSALTQAFAGRRTLQRCCLASKLICCSIEPRSHRTSVWQALLLMIMPRLLLLLLAVLMILSLLTMLLLLLAIMLLLVSLQLLLVLQRAYSLLCDT